MCSDSFFCHMSSKRIAQLIQRSRSPICYSAPGVQPVVAKAMEKAAKTIGPDLITVWIDFDERVMRMGYGDINAVETLKNAGIIVRHAAGLRSAFIIADGQGYAFTPTPLYLEAEPGKDIRNALRLTQDQIIEALSRLAPGARDIAVAMAQDEAEKLKILSLPEESDFSPVDAQMFDQVDQGLKEAPPAKFDVARQVRVFEPYLQYVELSLTGAAIQRQRVAIPPQIQKLGGTRDLEGRLKTTFELIEKRGKLSSKPLEDELNQIRKDLTPSLGKGYGRAVLKGAKEHLQKRLEQLEDKLSNHQDMIQKELQKEIDQSKRQVVDYYIKRALDTPPDVLIGQSLSGRPTKEDAACWLKSELDKVFPVAESLIRKMSLQVSYKDVTYETLNQENFLEAVKSAFPRIDWDRTYNEYKAAKETGGEAA